MAKVLVVDESPGVRSMACTVLRSAGHEAIEADTTESALGALTREKPDVVIAGAFLPNDDWAHTIRGIRNAAKQLPIVVISGLDFWGVPSWRERAKELGVDLVLDKPLGISGLVKAVEELLALHPKRKPPG